MASAEDPGKRGQKRRRTELNISTKVEIANKLKQGTKVSVIIEEYGISRRTVQYIKSNATKLLENSANDTVSMTMIRNRASKFPEIEKCLLHFVKFARQMKVPITCSVLQAKALLVKQSLIERAVGESHKKALGTFTASQGWVARLVKRNGIRSVLMHGETEYGDKIKDDESIIHTQEFIKNYNPENIYNVNETALFFRLLPCRTYVSEMNNRKSVRDMRNMGAKDRITAYVCTNATGSEKLPITIIGTANNPSCFNNSPPPVPYFAQEQAWSDGPTFQNWYFNVFLPYIRHRTSKPVALIMDNLLAQGTEVKDVRNQVTVFMIPRSHAVVHQPVDCGVIESFKVIYRYMLLKEVLLSLEERDIRRESSKNMKPGTRGLSEGYEPHVLDAAEIIVKAWNNVSTRTISSCWIKSGILPPNLEATLSPEHGILSENLKAIRTIQEGDVIQLTELFNEVCNAKLRCEDMTDETLGDFSAAIVQKWTCLEEHEDVKEALVDDDLMIMTEVMRDEAAQSSKTTDADMQMNSDEVRDAQAESIPVPSVACIAQIFSEVEALSSRTGVCSASFHLRKAKQALINARREQESKRSRQILIADVLK